MSQKIIKLHKHKLTNQKKFPLPLTKTIFNPKEIKRGYLSTYEYI